MICGAKAVGGFVAGSPALLSEAAHSVADSLNEVFLLASVRRSRRPADERHPFGYGKRFSLLRAVLQVRRAARSACHGLAEEVRVLSAGIDLNPGYDSEAVEDAMLRVRTELKRRWPELDQVFLDVTDAAAARSAHAARRAGRTPEA